MKYIKKIVILGVGFMGGSLALALKEKFPKFYICGFARNNHSYRRLKRLNLLDKVERDLEKLIKDADFIVLAMPVYAIIDFLKKISPFLLKDTVIFDLGSSKALIEECARRILPKGISFVGCHPLCGSERSGASFSQRNLFKGSLCIITSSAAKIATRKVKKIWEELGAKIVFLSPDFHDEVLSCVSHLPHLISFSLTQSVPANYFKYSLASLKNLTRISDSPAAIWRDIFLSNAKYVSKDISRFIKILKIFKKAISNKDAEGIFKLIRKANAKHKILNRNKDSSA